MLRVDKGKIYYIENETEATLDATKGKDNGKLISRNRPCICGSGKKLKDCCITKFGLPGRQKSIKYKGEKNNRSN